MASGVYGKSDLSATTWTEIVAPPATGVKVTTLNIVNRSDANRKVRVALSADTTVTDEEYIEYNVTLPANGVLERTGIVCSANNGLYVYADGASVSAVAYGMDA
tara:strand:+ start:418 stop:729 length:312 start_codon:yes stop_codon:yes gene_type:complete